MQRIGPCDYCHCNRERNVHHIIPHRFLSTSKRYKNRERNPSQLLDLLFPEPSFMVNGKVSIVCLECHNDADGLIPKECVLLPGRYYELDAKLRLGEKVERELIGQWAAESHMEIEKRKNILLQVISLVVAFPQLLGVNDSLT